MSNNAQPERDRPAESDATSAASKIDDAMAHSKMLAETQVNVSGADKLAVKDKAVLPELELGQIKKGETTRETVKIDGEDCQFLLRVPESYDPKKPMPLIIAFHGYGDKPGQGDTKAGAEGMEPVTGLSERAEKDGFIVAYLNGNPKEKNAWNNNQWFFSNRDDVKFTKTVMDNLSKDLNVDQERIYLVGFSNGASFAHRAAGALADRVAAVADVSGWMTGQEKAEAKGVSMLSIHSKADDAVKFDGRPIWQGVVMKPSQYTTEHYRKINDMPTMAAVAQHTQAANGTQIDTYSYKDPVSKTEVKSIFIENEGHVWFGGKANENAPVNATDEVLKFFSDKRKVRDAGSSATAKELQEMARGR